MLALAPAAWPRLLARGQGEDGLGTRGGTARWDHRVGGKGQLSGLCNSLFLLQISISLDPSGLELHRGGNGHWKSPPSLAGLGVMPAPPHHSVGKVGEAPRLPSTLPAPRRQVFSSTPGQEKTFQGQPEQCPLPPLHPTVGDAAHPRWQARGAPVWRGVLGRENCTEISALVRAGKTK